MSTSKHILIIEDEALIALDMAATLEELGHRVTTVAAMREAERLVWSGDIDLAVLDYHLKDGTTDRLARQLQERGVPFVICSGTAGLSELGAAFQRTTFLAKPFTSEAFIDAILTAEAARI